MFVPNTLTCPIRPIHSTIPCPTASCVTAPLPAKLIEFLNFLMWIDDDDDSLVSRNEQNFSYFSSHTKCRSLEYVATELCNTVKCCCRLLIEIIR
ncbi:hypothetical protein PUN28_016573 [Cardiocondyla obscurior]|uniref:Uncharacterized protein n=1 Tax=Cardiocondyla obscurior TaxID=286306 RepID=A0AAW2EQ42_9HYME